MMVLFDSGFKYETILHYSSVCDQSAFFNTEGGDDQPPITFILRW